MDNKLKIVNNFIIILISIIFLFSSNIAQAKKKYFDPNYIFKKDTFHKWSEDVGFFGKRYEMVGNQPHNGWNHVWVKEPTRDGGNAMKFELKNGDCNNHDCPRGDWEGMFGRTEIIWGHGAKGITDEMWYRWSLFVPNDTKARTGYQMLTQFKFHNKAEHNVCPVIPLYFFLENDGLYLNREIALDEDLNDEKDDCDPTEEVLIIKGEENVKDKWLDFVVHVNWTHKENEGFMKVWINGNKVYDLKGQTTNEPYHHNGEKYGPVFRTCIYEGNKDKGNYSTIVYYDAFYGSRKCSKMKFSKIGYSCDQFETK